MRAIKTTLERQLFNDGLLKAYVVKNVAEEGMKPQYDKALVYSRVPYADKTAGEKRKFYAAYDGKEFDRVVRIQREWGLTVGNLVELNDTLYKVISENGIFSVYPPFSEITLRKVENLNECID